MECKHPAESHVIDQHEGSIICSLCARVVGDYFITRTHTDASGEFEQVSPNLQTIVDNNHINVEIRDKAITILKDVRSMLPKRNIMHIEMFALYHGGLKTKNPYLMSEISLFFGLPGKVVCKIISSISKAIKYKYADNTMQNPIRYLRRLGGCIMSSRDAEVITRQYNDLAIKFAHKTPKLFLASIIFNFKKRGLDASGGSRELLRILSKQFSVNDRSIKLLDREIDCCLAAQSYNYSEPGIQLSQNARQRSS